MVLLLMPSFCIHCSVQVESTPFWGVAEELEVPELMDGKLKVQGFGEHGLQRPVGGFCKSARVSGSRGYVRAGRSLEEDRAPL